MEVGNTPLIQLSDKLYGKYEALNPGGSIKIDLLIYFRPYGFKQR